MRLPRHGPSDGIPEIPTLIVGQVKSHFKAARMFSFNLNSN
jgi:hypothetical protein